MSKIKELLIAQAECVKSKSDKIKKAEALEKKAKQLREEASPLPVINFKKYIRRGSNKKDN